MSFNFEKPLQHHTLQSRYLQIYEHACIIFDIYFYQMYYTHSPNNNKWNKTWIDQAWLTITPKLMSIYIYIIYIYNIYVCILTIAITRFLKSSSRRHNPINIKTSDFRWFEHIFLLNKCTGTLASILLRFDAPLDWLVPPPQFITNAATYKIMYQSKLNGQITGSLGPG